MNRQVNLPAREEVQEWQAHPVTQAFRAQLGVLREQCRDALEGGLIFQQTTHESLLELARLKGFLDAVNQMQEIDYADFISDVEG